MLAAELFALMPEVLVPVVVPVVVMLSAPSPSLSALIPRVPVVASALIVREVPAVELFA